MAVVSLDPRSGELCPYPPRIARVIREAMRGPGDRRVGLGNFLGATVHRVEGRMFQTRAGGRSRRDVACPDGPACFRVARTRRGWRLSDAGEAVRRWAPPAGAGGWQWRRGGDGWGAYDADVDAEMTAAFEEGRPHVDVVLGARRMRIDFGTMTQTDLARSKRRRIRWARVDRPPAAPEPAAAPCAICLGSLGGAMPPRRLPCGHTFHGVCLEPVLGGARPACPLCRAPLG